jgi:hypothetical protein
VTVVLQSLFLFSVSHHHAVDHSPLFTAMIGDFTDAATCLQLMQACGGSCDVVLCDAAPNSSGQQWWPALSWHWPVRSKLPLTSSSAGPAIFAALSYVPSLFK